MTTLKEAQRSGNLDKFIKEHASDPKGDKDQLDKTIDKFVGGKSKSTEGTSEQDSS